MPATGRRCSPARSSLSCRSRCSSTSPTCRTAPASPSCSRPPPSPRVAWRTGARWAAVGAGLCWGLAAFARPYDAALMGWRWRQPRAWCSRVDESVSGSALAPLVGLAALGAVGPLLASLAFNHAMTGDALQLPFRILEAAGRPGPRTASLAPDRPVRRLHVGSSGLLVRAEPPLGVGLGGRRPPRRLPGRGDARPSPAARRAAGRRCPRCLVSRVRALLGLLRRRVPVGRSPVPGTLLLPPDGGDAGDPGWRRAG